MEEFTQSTRTLHFCGICGSKPDQISHHKAHLKTQKHLFKKKCFEQCLNMTVFHFHTTNNTELIVSFEEETGLKKSENVDKFRIWRFELVSKLNDLLKQEFPQAVIPDGNDLNVYSNSKEEFIKNWLERIVQVNESRTIKEKIKVNLNEHNSYKQEIRDKNIDELILKAIQTKHEFDIAVILYKINIDKYSFKDFRTNLWINKHDTTIPSKFVLCEIRNQLNTIITDIFTNYSNNLTEDRIEDKNTCTKIISMLTRTIIKNNIMKEAKELFYDN